MDIGNPKLSNLPENLADLCSGKGLISQTIPIKVDSNTQIAFKTINTY